MLDWSAVATGRVASRRGRLARLISVLALVSTLAVGTATGTSASGTPAWLDKVDRKVLAAAADGPTEFLVYFHRQADLSGAASLPTKEAKGRHVYERLTAVARETQAGVVADLRRLAVRHRAFWISNLVWAVGDLDAVRAVARRPEVARVYGVGSGRLEPPVAGPHRMPNGPDAVEPNLVNVRAPEVWALGYTGQGAVVAGADTGVFWEHAALMEQYRGRDGVTENHDYNWHDSIHNPNPFCPADSPEPCDDDALLGGGHGTHTVGTIVGDDGGENQIGMAPGAEWIACRNMNQGLGVIPTYMECMEWFIAPTEVDGDNPDPSKAPHVINNSWGCVEVCPPPALQDTLQASRAAGIFYAVSAGNDGPECSTLQFPLARYPESFTVGATDHTTDQIADFSSRGPVLGDPDFPTGLMKPNISAPGVDVRSAQRDGSYAELSGTSMAGPHVAGLVALLISADPSLAGDIDSLEDIIEQAAVPKTTDQGCGEDGPTDVPNNTYGWGRIDALAAVNQVLPTVSLTGKASTNYPGQGKVVLSSTVSDDLADPAPPTGKIQYQDTRTVPPGDAAGPFNCKKSTPTTLSFASPSTVTISGTMTCSGFAAVRSFTLEVTDNGPNPPNRDAYHMTLFDVNGGVVYDWSDLTSLNKGDLTVTVM
jgi:serine protease AprX